MVNGELLSMHKYENRSRELKVIYDNYGCQSRHYYRNFVGCRLHWAGSQGQNFWELPHLTHYECCLMKFTIHVSNL